MRRMRGVATSWRRSAPAAAQQPRRFSRPPSSAARSDSVCQQASSSACSRLGSAGGERLAASRGATIDCPEGRLQITARAEGLGCVLTTLLCICEAEVRELLDIPERWGTAAAIPLGYPVGKGHGPIRRRATSSLVFDDSFGNKRT